MVTILGERGMLGSVVRRRWAEHRGPYIVNCIRPDDIDLSWRLAETGFLIQPSTDAIAEPSDYARTKRIIEQAPGAVVIRSGLVDIRNRPTVAYRNWLCNPLTPLEWADYAWAHRDEPGVHAIGRETVSRLDVVRLVAELWDSPQPIPANSDTPLDRVQPAGDFPPLRDALIEYRAWL